MGADASPCRGSPRAASTSTLELGDHERLAVLGPNGAGKSTLLGILAGTLRPDSGRAELDGEPLFDVRPPGRWPAAAPAPRRAAGPGPAALPAPRRARERRLRAPRGRRTPRVRRKPRPARGSRGRGRRARRPPTRRSCPAGRPSGSPSPGPSPPTRGCCCSTSRWPRSTSPSPRSSAACCATCWSAGRRSLVTHDLLDALLLSDRVAVLEGGRVVETGPTAEVLRHPRTPVHRPPRRAQPGARHRRPTGSLRPARGCTSAAGTAGARAGEHRPPPCSPRTPSRCSSTPRTAARAPSSPPGSASSSRRGDEVRVRTTTGERASR